MATANTRTVLVYAAVAAFVSVCVQGRAVNISNTWVLPEEGFPVFYRYFRDRISWYEADAVCQFHHGNLVTVDTTSQFDAVRAYLKELDIVSNVWIGLTRAADKNEFCWSNEQTLSAEGYWGEATPVTGSAVCTATDPAADFRWHALTCGGPEIASFICELPVPPWASGSDGCMLTSLPSLTVIYLPEQTAVELTSDCGLDGTKRIACKGKADHEEMMHQLSCGITREDFDAVSKSPLPTSDTNPRITPKTAATKPWIWTSNTIDTGEYNSPTRHRRETEDTFSTAGGIGTTISQIKETSSLKPEILTTEATKITTMASLPETTRQKPTKENIVTTIRPTGSSERYGAEVTTDKTASLERAGRTSSEKSTETQRASSDQLASLEQLETQRTSSEKSTETQRDASGKSTEVSLEKTTEKTASEKPGAEKSTTENNTPEFPSINQGQLFSIIENGTLFDIIEVNDTSTDVDSEKTTKSNLKQTNQITETLYTTTAYYKDIKIDENKTNLLTDKLRNSKTDNDLSNSGKVLAKSDVDIMASLVKLNRTNRKELPLSEFNLTDSKIDSKVNLKDMDLDYTIPQGHKIVEITITDNVERKLYVTTKKYDKSKGLKLKKMNLNVDSPKKVQLNSSEPIMENPEVPIDNTTETFQEIQIDSKLGDFTKNSTHSETTGQHEEPTEKSEESTEFDELKTDDVQKGDNIADGLKMKSTTVQEQVDEVPEEQPRPNRNRVLTRPQRRSFYPYFFSRVLG